jgi:hypothetical protein
MPNDPKFRVVARKSGQPLSLVLAVYLHVLVSANVNEAKRGETQLKRNETQRNAMKRSETECNENETLCNGSETHCNETETFAAALDVEKEQVDAIIDAMQGILLDGPKVTGWEKRQVLREDDSAYERVKKHRENKQLDKNSETHCNAVKRTETQVKRNETQVKRNETQCNEKKRQEEEEEKERESEPESVFGEMAEVNTLSPPPLATALPEKTEKPEKPEKPPETAVPSKYGLICRAMREAGIPDANPGHPEFMKLVDAGVTLETFVETAKEAVRKNKPSFNWIIAAIEGRIREANQSPIPKINPKPNPIDSLMARAI